MDDFTKVSPKQSNPSAKTASPVASTRPKLSVPLQLTRASQVLVGLLIVATSLFILTSVMRYAGVDLSKSTQGVEVAKTKYQAVFLQNGQVYFGKIKNINTDFMKLEDIYYLQVTQQPVGDALQGQQKDAKGTTEDKAQPQISLAKLGKELHGPEDKMFIRTDSVLFWENLKSDSKVAAAIKNFKKQ